MQMIVKAQICCTNENKKLSPHSTCVAKNKRGIAYQNNWAREVYIFITSQCTFQKNMPIQTCVHKNQNDYEK